MYSVIKKRHHQARAYKQQLSQYATTCWLSETCSGIPQNNIDILDTDHTAETIYVRISITVTANTVSYLRRYRSGSYTLTCHQAWLCQSGHCLVWHQQTAAVGQVVLFQAPLVLLHSVLCVRVCNKYTEALHIMTAAQRSVIWTFAAWAHVPQHAGLKSDSIALMHILLLSWHASVYQTAHIDFTAQCYNIGCKMMHIPGGLRTSTSHTLSPEDCCSHPVIHSVQQL
jgi:hypothetical protein